MNVEAAHANILKFLKDEFNYRVNKIKNPIVKANSLLGRTKEKDYTPEQRKVYDQIVEEATEEAKKQGDIVMNVTEDFLSIEKSKKKDSEWKKAFTNTSQVTAKLSNDLNTLLKNVITPGEANSPTWAKTSEAASQADDRAYRLLTTLIPGAKKITYHVNDDQLEVETDKYTYTAARNGSKEVGIQGSDIVATDSAASYGFAPDKFATINSNTTVNNNNGGWAKASNEGYGEFSNLIGQDHGIERTNVLTDKALSDKIIEKLGPGNEKLGRAGYFSTADIPLGTDIVSYTVQVIPSDDGRVGVNPQSSRIQYNMPILADFSVIQDTTGPSKEVARRIITKLKEQGKITGDQEKKIKEEIDKSKKTSEVRSAMSGDVIVRYVDTDGNNLPISDADAKKAGEKTDNGYLVRKDVLIGTDYDVNSKKVPSFNATNGKNYALRSVGGGLETSSDAPSGSITKKNTVITFVYEERTIPPTGKGLVHFKKQVSETTTEALTGYDDITLSGNVGETFSSTEVDTKITELKNAGYEIVTNEFDTNSKTIDSTADVDGQDPSQVYNVIVREKVETVTTPPTPDKPVDPNIPEGPKWPESGLKESDLTKEVTRTINYFKKETADGEKIANAQPTKVDKVLYKRTATYNLVSKEVTYSDWTATADATHTATSFSPVKTPVLAGYVADFKEVTDAPAAPTANGEVTNMTKEVVYTKLGSWVPKIPGKTSTPIPYPNDPNDATKPKYPDYPTTPENPDGTPVNPGGETPGTPEKPKTPVIPYVEGYVPKIPTDPTTPVGEDNPLKPLVPIDSNDPKKGYKVPELPNDPKKDTVIEYKPNPQKILIKVVNVTTGEEVELPNEKLEFNGVSDQVVTSEDKGKVDKKIDSLQKRGYIVSTKNPITETTKYDTKDDSSQKEPTQTYKIIVNEPVTKDTEVRKVTRTIKYVKIDVQDGNEVRTELNTEKIKTKVDKVEFSRDTTTSLATGLTKIGAWDQETKELPKVNTPVLVGYIANVVSVENKSVSPDTESYEVTVEYRKIGSWVPNLPEGVTPPTGTDMTPKPYPNNPTDPTKPGTPVYPEPGTPITPGTPVIPYVPGYTPKTPDGNPLVPVDPEHPGNGYKVPPVPTEPGTNTDITYVADPQKAVVKVFNTTTGTEVELPAEKVSIDNGTTDAAIPTDSVTAKIADLEKRGYVVENKDLLKDQKFDKEKDPTDGDPTQVFKLKVHEKVVTVTEPKNPNDPVDPDKPEGPKWPTEGLAKSDLEKEVTRTITYVKKETADGPEIADAKPTKKQTAHFKRSATYNLVTKVVTPGEWTSTDKTLEAVPTEKLDGYVANVSSVEEVETNVNSTNLDRKVVYTKLGSWIPKVPGVETPTPLPYPNHPTDPTKPGTPVYPEPGQPITPGTPVIPYVPGYTPKIGETPLQPVDPNNPGKGYKVPPVPTEPGTNTDITYVADPQKAVVKVFNTTTGTEVELPAEKVSIDNGTTDAAIPTDSVTAKIADLEKRGYVVENKDLLKDQKFDKEKDPTDGDPTQVFKLKVHEKVVTVTEPKNPNDPVDPDKPEGPKWPTEGLAKSDLEKEVTRTITYVKKETADGPEIADAKPTVTQTAHFKRSATYNAVTGTITYGSWESADKELAKVDTPELTGYVADKASVDKVETNADSTGLDQKVVYTKLGSWVPNLPEGVTPPTGTDMTPKPYPNNPTDPTKPGEPTDPNVPVIPYVPGYTPKIGETPLVPKVPTDPTQGYIPPKVPTTPGEDTPITYEGNPQKALVKVVKVDGTTETPLPKDNVTINGKTGDQIPTESVTAKIADLEKRGYVIDNRDEVVNYINKKFDKDKDTEGQDPTQTVTLKVHEKVVPVTPPTDDKPLEPGKPIDPDTPVDPNNPNNPNDPTIPRWTDELIKKLDVKKEVTRTINYVDETGNKVSEPSTDKVTFTREAKINVVTGEITYGDWKAVGGDSTFDKVSSPVVKGYILKDPAQKEVAERKGITPTVANQTIEVVYKKLGSWVPKVPGVETPTPLPYPNHPTDPTKPGDPTDPNTPNVPVIPYVPGYTPKTPDGNPLVPVDPNHPENGYKVPPVPTKPGNDTPIEYVKVPNTPSPEEPVKPTPESNHITIWVDENGKPLKPEKPGTHEPGNIPGYRYITTVTKDGVTIHKFEKITPVDHNNPVPQKPTTPLPTPQDPTIPTPESQIPTPNTPESNTPTSETNRREELPNTGTEANAGLASAGIMTLLAGLGLGFFKKKEEDESE